MPAFKIDKENFFTFVEKIESVKDDKRSDLIRELHGIGIDIENDEKAVVNIANKYFDELYSIKFYNFLLEASSTFYEFSDFYARSGYDFVKEFIDVTLAEKSIKERESVSNFLYEATINCPIVYYRTKYNSVKNNNFRNFTGSKIISSIKPVFAHSEKPTEIDKDSAFSHVITHELNIKYLENEIERDFFVTMDEYDIDILIRVLERAKVKNNIIENWINE